MLKEIAMLNEAIRPIVKRVERIYKPVPVPRPPMPEQDRGAIPRKIAGDFCKILIGLTP